MHTISGAKSPVCAGSLVYNGIRLSFFRKTLDYKQLPEALGSR